LEDQGGNTISLILKTPPDPEKAMSGGKPYTEWSGAIVVNEIAKGG